MKVGFIGAGKMAEAIIAALIRTEQVEAHEVFASDIDEGRRADIKRRFGINVYSTNDAVVAAAPQLVLAVKPQHLDRALEPLASHITAEHLVLSIAAGKTIASVERLIPAARVVRVMPNLPVTVGAGMSVYCPGTRATDADEETAEEVLTALGRVLKLPEDLFDAVTAISGSGPAFLAHFLDCLVQAGLAQNLRREDALLLALQTALGTARLLLERDMEPAELIRAVSSPGGTTVAGMAVLQRAELADTVRETIAAAVQRGRELNA